MPGWRHKALGLEAYKEFSLTQEETFAKNLAGEIRLHQQNYKKTKQQLKPQEGSIKTKQNQKTSK